MPKLWNETIQTHRAAVRDAILDTTAQLAATHGVASVTMSQIAEAVGIGRATLYKYFPDVEAILLAWHERQVSGHLQQLAEVSNQAGKPTERLEAVLEAYAGIHYDLRAAHHGRRGPGHAGEGPAGTELAAFLHQGAHVAQAQRHLHDFVQALLAEAAQTGDIRNDVAPEELASYCLHALTAASSLPSEAAVSRLVTVTLAGLRPPR